MSKNITIDDLYSDAGSFDEPAVLEILKGRITFLGNHEIVFLSDITELKTRDTILLYALAKKVLKANGKIDDDTITAHEIAKNTKLNSNTLSVTVMRLKNSKMLMPSGGSYELPSFKVKEAIALLKNYKE